jgi:hypothetical protein
MAAALVVGQGRLVEGEPMTAVATAVKRRPAGEEKTFRPYDPDRQGQTERRRVPGSRLPIVDFTP